MTLSKPEQPDLTIVIPAYREESRLGRTLEELASFLQHDSFCAQKDVEVIVVAADAPDRTQEIAAAKQESFKRLTLLKPGPKVGKGRDVQAGMLRAQGKVVLFMDADLATPLHHIEAFYKQGADIVIATRDVRSHRNTSRVFVSVVGNILFRLAGGVWVEDSQCGFKMFSAAAAQLCFKKLKIMGWGFDMEILTIAKVNHLAVRSVHIDDWRPIPDGSFEDGVIKNSVRALFDLLIILYRRLTGYYAVSSKID